MSNRSGGGFSCHMGTSAAQPEIHVIKLHKSTNGMGLSIVAAKVRTFEPGETSNTVGRWLIL